MKKFLKEQWEWLLGAALVALSIYGLWDLTWAERGHVLDRFVLHVFSGASVLIIFMYAWWLCERWVKGWPRLEGWLFFTVPGFIAFTVIALRESYDVAMGNPLQKSFFDHASWIIGIFGFSYAIYRLYPRLRQAMEEIEKRRSKK